MIRKQAQKYDPLTLQLNLTRAIGLIILWVHWIITSGEAIGMFLLLGLIIFLILRQYLPKNRLVLFGGGVFVGGLSCLWPMAFIAISFPVFEGYLENKPFLILPGLLLGSIRWDVNITPIFVLVFAGFLGYLHRTAIQERDYYKDEADRERRSRYEAEGLNEELLSLRQEMLEMTKLAERNRIAQKLHDDVGHELTGAVLGLQAFESIFKERDLKPLEEELFYKIEERVNNSAQILRETVHNMKPYIPLGIENFNLFVEDFKDIPVTFKVFGNTENVPMHYWILLKAALKEGLTNILRHSNASKVLLQVDITLNVLRFSLENDGTISGKFYEEGMGLRSLRKRIKAYGGTVSVANEKEYFRLIIVMPLWKDEKFHE